MTTFSAASVAHVLLDVGVLLAPLAWLAVAVAVGACFAIVAWAVHELGSGRSESPYSLSLGRVDVRGIVVRPLVTEPFDKAA
jgi:hypothetical protein